MSGNKAIYIHVKHRGILRDFRLVPEIRQFSYDLPQFQHTTPKLRKYL